MARPGFYLSAEGEPCDQVCEGAALPFSPDGTGLISSAAHLEGALTALDIDPRAACPGGYEPASEPFAPYCMWERGIRISFSVALCVALFESLRSC